MPTNRLHRPLRRLVAASAVIACASALLAGALVVPAGAAASAPFATKLALSSTPAKLVTGEPATFTAKVTSPFHGVPAGQVTFSITEAGGTALSCDTGVVQTLSGGVATCGVAAGLLSSDGPFAVSAQYVDTVDGNYQSSTASLTQTVVAANTTTTVTSSQDPAVTGEALEFTAAVAPSSPATGAPTGTVTFGGVTCDDGNVVTLVGDLAQCTIAAGLVSQGPAYSVTASYSGDANFNGSAGNVKESVKAAATTLTLAPTAGTCDGDLCTIGQGDAFAFTATAAAAGTDGGSGTPQGTVTFAIDKPGSNASLSCGGGTNVIPLVDGTATCNIPAGLPAIVYYKVSATLAATGYLSSTATLYENSSLSDTTTTVAVPKGADAVGAGQTFVVTATVSPAAGYTGSNVPTGYVNLLVCGENSYGDDGCQGGATPVGPGGVATLTIGGGEYPGIYSTEAVYTGDSNFYSSSAKSMTFDVTKSSTVLSLSEPGGFYSTDGAGVAITATVDVPDGAAGSSLVLPPTGNVTFTITDPDGNAITCEGGNVIALPVAPGETEGSVTCVLPPGTLTDLTPPATDYSVQASYSGDSDFGLSSARATQVVVAAAD